MILGIHYFITKLKTKIDVIPMGCFKLNLANWNKFQSLEVVDRGSETQLQVTEN